jgi:hypothetical protein
VLTFVREIKNERKLMRAKRFAALICAEIIPRVNAIATQNTGRKASK